MTNFTKENFAYHGGYLTYRGEYEGRPAYEAGPNVHPSNVGRKKDLFVARFKYARSPFTKAQFQKELIKNHTVESYVAASKAGKAPLEILREANPTWYENIMNKFREKNLQTA